jgi:hypothetical protein
MKCDTGRRCTGPPSDGRLGRLPQAEVGCNLLVEVENANGDHIFVESLRSLAAVASLRLS